MRACNWTGDTPLHLAAKLGSPCATDFLCRRLPEADINRARRNDPCLSPLGNAASALDYCSLPHGQQLRDQREGEETVDREKRFMQIGSLAALGLQERERLLSMISRLKRTARVLLRAGAEYSLSRMPADTDGQRSRRELMATEYASVLNEDLPNMAMAALIVGLAAHRSFAAHFMYALPLGPHVSAAISWRIAAFCFDEEAAKESISAAFPFRHTDMARRVVAAIEHFVKYAALRASSNREVVGAMADVGGQMVRVPLQCFAVWGQPGGQHRVLGVREVVHRARLDEAAKCGVQGAVLKGFNEHLGNDDCQFAWGQLGYIDKRRQFVSLRIK
ncbi:unnamed protein product [Vitrella brassicaformis CCMP3155]|uniref:Uncharacterized protein n=1 Tax=Vitrella brassicaformis (strain CCMP3155) TaxID=1169540 RepID=A0A0G4FF25_VITBC|nr:unnamed protein product [Vitrella brassicaformis CCMP3155]|eukprot:CEM11430.1 unnamed protein product [Vitrella brassicaformis CCMP3155]